MFSPGKVNTTFWTSQFKMMQRRMPSCCQWVLSGTIWCPLSCGTHPPMTRFHSADKQASILSMVTLLLPLSVSHWFLSSPTWYATALSFLSTISARSFSHCLSYSPLLSCLKWDRNFNASILSLLCPVSKWSNRSLSMTLRSLHRISCSIWRLSG